MFKSSKHKQSSSKRNKILRTQDVSSDEGENVGLHHSIASTKSTKRSRPIRRSQHEHEEEEEDEKGKGKGDILMDRSKKDRKRKKKKKKHIRSSHREGRGSDNAGGGVSFTFDEGDVDTSMNIGEADGSTDGGRRKKRKKGKSKRQGLGLGFGGDIGNSMEEQDDDVNVGEENDGMNGVRTIIKPMQSSSSIMYHDDYDEDENDQTSAFKTFSSQTSSYTLSSNDNTTATSTSRYDKEALQMLKNQQKSYTNNNATMSTDTKASNDQDTEMNIDHSSKSSKDTNLSAIPSNLNGMKTKTTSETSTTPSNNTSMKTHKSTSSSNDPFENGQDFISFNSNKRSFHSTTHGYSDSPNEILAGDDVLAYDPEEDEEVKDDGNHDDHGKSDVGNRHDTSDDILAGIADNEPTSSEKDEETNRWEEEIARRAGVEVSHSSKPLATSRASTTNLPSSTSSNAPNDTNTSKSNIRNTIESTIETLKVSDQDLESTIGRRKHDCEMAKEEAEKKEKEMASIGTSFEYYQTLRLELSNHVGAMRYLSEKVTLIEKSLQEFYEDVSLKHLRHLQEWEDDTITILARHKWLDTTLGDRESISMKDAMIGMSEVPTVDEFGRDKNFMVNLAREKRRKKRRQIYQSRRPSMLEDGDNHRDSQTWATKDTLHLVQSTMEESDGDISDNELMDREERRHAFSDATQVVLDEVDEEYASPNKLIEHFKDWLQSYADDFHQSYANLTVVELMTTMAKIDFCQNLDISGHMKDNYKGDEPTHFISRSVWFQKLKELDTALIGDGALDNSEETGEQSTQRLIVTKVCLPMLLKMFSGESATLTYNPLSRKQSRVVSHFYRSVYAILKDDESTHQHMLKLNQTMLQYFKDYIKSNFSLPLMTRESSELLVHGGENKNEEDKEAIIYAGFGQLYLLKKFISNLSTIWYPIMDNESAKNIAQFCLMDLIGDKFLRILSNMDILDNKQQSYDDTTYSTQLNKVFTSLYNTVQEAGWLTRDELMLFASPLRAAAALHTSLN